MERRCIVKLQIITEAGILIDTIPNIDEYNLDRPFARNSVLNEIKRMVVIGDKFEYSKEETKITTEDTDKKKTKK